MNTLSYNGITLALPDDLEWPNEFGWSPVQQKAVPSITGALIIDIGVQTAGRLIELNGSQNTAWMTREVADQLRGWASIGGAQMTLMLRGAPRNVLFDHERGGFAAEPVPAENYSDPAPTDRVIPRLRFIEI